MTKLPSRVEIIPPSVSTTPRAPEWQSVQRLPVSSPYTGGVFSSNIAEWRARHQTTAIEALTKRDLAAAQHFAAQVKAADSYIERERAFARVRDLPATLAMDQYRRDAEREEEILEILHIRNKAARRRAAELDDMDAERRIASAKRHNELADQEIEGAIRSVELERVRCGSEQHGGDLLDRLAGEEEACNARGDYESAARLRQARALLARNDRGA